MHFEIKKKRKNAYRDKEKRKNAHREKEKMHTEIKKKEKMHIEKKKNTQLRQRAHLRQRAAAELTAELRQHPRSIIL